MHHKQCVCESAIPMRTISSACKAIFLRRNPGNPSYQMLANNCCTFGCATNFFCRNLMANFSRFKCIRSPCSYIGPVGSWFSITSSSLDVRVWSSRAVAKSWHCLRSSWYSFLNSCSRKLSRRNSHDNSKAVSIGSLDDSAIRLGLAKAR